MHKLRSQYEERFGKFDQDDYESMLEWIASNRIEISFDPYKAEDINGAIVKDWEHYKNELEFVCKYDEPICHPCSEPKED